jgi:glycolate oxidase FAD binding subunit
MASSTVRPESVPAAAELMRELGRAGRPIAIRGAGTKAGWLAAETEVTLETAELNHVLEHNEGDFTAVLEAGVPFAQAQAQFAASAQMLALDPPLSSDGGEPRATIGGVVASADSGPLRHRYGGVRDLILGVTIVLSDGTVAKAGGRVIKNVAGYDLGKLFAGSYGTLGLIATVAVRLHPLAEQTATVQASSDDAPALARAAGRLAALPIEADCLDLAWSPAGGVLLVRFAGATAPERATETERLIGELGLTELTVTEDDAALWAAQRAAQREPEGTVIKVAGVTADTVEILGAAQALGARVVARPALGLAWVALAGGEDIEHRVGQLRAALPAVSLTALDGAAAIPERWPTPAPAALNVMDRLKARFDPAHICAPGAFVGGL